MKKAWNNPKVIFTALQVCSVIALLPAVIALEAAAKGALQEEPLVALQMGVSALCWGIMWLSFLLMCGRLKRETSAFTERNARTLLIIAVCCGVLGAWMVMEAAAEAQRMTRGILLGGWLGSVAIVAMFFGVAAVALVLRGLLKSAMALQKDSDLTI